MHNYMFRSRLGALVFAVLVVIGAVSLVGTEEESGTIVEASDDIARQKAEMDAEIARENSLDEADEDDDVDEEEIEGWDEEDDPYLTDDELIDDTAGEDTTPLTSTDPNEEFDEFLVSDD